MSLATAAPSEGPRWYEIEWFEWLGLAGFALTLLGLYLTYRQASNARTAATAAGAAVEATQERLRANYLLVVVPNLKGIAARLDTAISMDDDEGTRQYLDQWRDQAGQVYGMLKREAGEDAGIVKTLQTSMALAFAANTALLGGKRPVVTACKRARESVAQSCDELNTWIGDRSFVVPGQGGNS